MATFMALVVGDVQINAYDLLALEFNYETAKRATTRTCYDIVNVDIISTTNLILQMWASPVVGVREILQFT